MEPDYVYGDAEREIVKSGYEAIEAVLVGRDVNAKRRLLFYLEWYIDPTINKIWRTCMSL